jgi:hypothetical protein
MNLGLQIKSGVKSLALNLGDRMDKKNLAVVRQSFAQTVFTHQVQEIAATNKRKKVFWVKIFNIILVAAVLVLLLFQAKYPEQLLFAYVGAGVTVAEIIFLIIQLTFDFEGQSLLHKNSALKYMDLRDRYRLLIADIMNDKRPKEELIAQRNALQNEYQSISDLAPPTGKNEYDAAQIVLNKKGLVGGEQFTWSDKEIDHFLPEELRLTKSKQNKK